MIEVRHAVPGDGDALGEIHAASWEAAYAPFFDPQFAAGAVRDRRTQWHQRIAEGTGTILLAAFDGRPLALSYSFPSSTRPGYAEIYSFYGHPDGWGDGNWRPASLLASIERSLKRLRTDHLDLIQFHSCDLGVLRRGEAIRALQTARERGLTRFIGYSGDGAAARFVVE